MKKSSYNSYRLFFKAFSNQTRFGIIHLLREGPKNVTEISRELGFEQSRVSHNLKCLENCGFVNSTWNGKHKIYSLDEEHIVPILCEIERHIEKYSKRLKCCGVLQE